MNALNIFALLLADVNADKALMLTGWKLSPSVFRQRVEGRMFDLVTTLGAGYFGPGLWVEPTSTGALVGSKALSDAAYDSAIAAFAKVAAVRFPFAKQSKTGGARSMLRLRWRADVIDEVCAQFEAYRALIES